MDFTKLLENNQPIRFSTQARSQNGNHQPVARCEPAVNGAVSKRAATSSGGICKGEVIAFDVACDGRTARINRMDPEATDQNLRYGDTFIINGKIYPAGTLEQGLSDPDQPGSIGSWVCRTFFYGETLENEGPHVATFHSYLLDDGNGLVSEGLAGGVNARRTIVGGMGGWASMRGYVMEEESGKNATVLEVGGSQAPAPNLRTVFTLIPR